MGARQPWQIVVCPVVIFCGSITPPCFEQTNTVSVSILPETFLPRRSDAAQIIIEGFHGGSWHRQVARQKTEQSWDICGTLDTGMTARSEEHTSELQSRFELVCGLLLEK